MDKPPTTSPEIREVGAADLAAVLPLFGQLGMDDGAVLAPEEAERLFAKMQRYPDYHLYLAIVDGQVAGIFALLVMDNLGHRGAPSGIVEDVIVREDWRNQGIGTAMMRFAMERCREKNCYKMVLSSDARRRDAHRFYEALGFDLHGYSFGVTRT